MIEFIVYDDQVEFRDKIKSSIEIVAKENNIEYEIKSFGSYTKEFDKTINSNISNKIYIMDIEVPDSISGIDVARKIRREDWNSIIILVTSHIELGYEALKAQIMLLDFICKQNNCYSNLRKTLITAVKKINNKKVIKLEAEGVTNRIYTDDIIYILRDNVERKCMIKTSYNAIFVHKSLKDILGELDNRFYLSHRSCIVNKDRIKTVNWRKGVIYFDNGTDVDYLSRDKKKGLRSYVG